MKWSKSFAKCQINQTPFYENENWEFAVSNNWHEICLMEQRLTLSWQFNRWVFCSAVCLWEFRLNIFMDVTFKQLINVTRNFLHHFCNWLDDQLQNSYFASPSQRLLTFLVQSHFSFEPNTMHALLWFHQSFPSSRSFYIDFHVLNFTV